MGENLLQNKRVIMLAGGKIAPTLFALSAPAIAATGIVFPISSQG
jgi:hypothetical protein